MSSVKCCEKCGRSRSQVLLLQLLILMVMLMSMSRDCQASPSRFNHSAFMDGVQSVVVNPYNRTILNMFDLTEEQIQSIQNRSNPNTKEETTQSSNHQYLELVASQRLNEIFKRLHKAISNEPNVNKSAEKAGYPICNAEMSIPNWQQANNLTLQFASSVFDHNGDRPSSALLRLYKTYPGQSPSQSQSQSQGQAESTEQPTATLCPDQAEVGPQIRVTVSIVHQQKKKRKLERKKRTCNTTMFSSSLTGWVEIDVKCALAYWEQQQRQQQPQQLLPSVVGMLMIEVHDDEENPLKPGLYFEPPTCDQADPAVPWNAYGSKTFVPYLESRSMPRYPRIDVGFNGSASFSPHNCLKSIYSIPKSRSHISPESTTPNSQTMDNLLDGTRETESQQERVREQVHQHHRRHHHKHRDSPASESEFAVAQSEGEAEAEELLAAASNTEPMEPSNHRVLNHHRATHHHNGRHHHKHHHHLMAHKQD
ncbi:protein anachronism isoform X1 [Drosophila pseudoobscura]|uniref:Protein anachronism isoform X1 n=1 Tax=Drosophila pseudoobscura pseudoobscura TaxID=46245 RepID=A0A6I8VFG5_DROPS|nr:protein anachronism isoform X1 [Drosophila pseudoobscura]